MLDGHLDGFHFLQRGLPASLHYLVNPALAEGHPVQVEQGGLGAFIAQVLFLALVNDRRFQPRPKAAV